MSKAKQLDRLSKLHLKAYQSLVIVKWTTEAFRHVSLNAERVRRLGLEEALVIEADVMQGHIERHLRQKAPALADMYKTKLHDCMQALEILRANK